MTEVAIERAPALDAAVAPVWLGVNLLLGVFATKIAHRLDPDSSLAERIMWGLVICASIVVESAILLGVLGALSGATFLGLVGIVSSVGLWRMRRCPVALECGAIDPTGAACASEATMWPTIAAWVWGGLLCLLVAHVVIDGLLKFPTDWDCLMYHMPMIDEWIQARNLYAPDSSYWWQPGVNEVLGLWCVAPFSGDFLIALNNLPVMVLWCAATWSLARSLGLSAPWSHLGAIAVVIVHTTLHETDDASNDLGVVAFWTAALACGLRYIRTERGTDIMLCGLSLGLLVGVKYFALGYAGLVGAALIVAVGFAHGLRAAGRTTLVLAIIAAPVGIFWYARNFVVSGSPIFPLGWTGATPSLGYPDVFSTTFLGNHDPSRFGIAVEILWKYTGPCHAAAVLLSPIALGALVASSGLARRDEDSRPTAAVRLVCAIALAGAFLVWIATPMLVEDEPGSLNHLRWGYTPVRFGLCFLSLAAVALVWMVAGVSCIRRVQMAPTSVSVFPGAALRRIIRVAFLNRASTERLAQIALASLVSWQAIRRCCAVWDETEFSPVDTLFLACNLMFGAAMIALLRHFAGAPRERRCQALFAAGMIVAFAGGALTLSHRWHDRFERHYDQLFGTTIFGMFHQSYPDGVRICALDNRIYPFFGSARQMHVCRPRFVDSLDSLERYLVSRRTAILVVQPATGRIWDMYKRAPGWLREHPNRFFRVQAGSPYDVFEFVVPTEAMK